MGSLAAQEMELRRGLLPKLLTDDLRLNCRLKLWPWKHETKFSLPFFADDKLLAEIAETAHVAAAAAAVAIAASRQNHNHERNC